MKFKHYLTERKAKAKAKRDPGKMLKCQECGIESRKVQVRIDPYRAELHGKKVKMNLCPECYQNRHDDV